MYGTAATSASEPIAPVAITTASSAPTEIAVSISKAATSRCISSGPALTVAVVNSVTTTLRFSSRSSVVASSAPCATPAARRLTSCLHASVNLAIVEVQ